MEASGVELLADSDDVYTNPEIEKLYDLSEPVNDFYSNYVYDFDTKLILISDVWGVISNGSLIIVKPRQTDLKKYNYDKSYSRYSVKYIDSVSFKLQRKNEDIENAFALLENKLSERDSISNIMKKAIDENDLDDDSALKIKNHLNKSLKKYQIKDTYLKIRADYLIRNPDKIDKTPTDKVKSTKKGYKCPFCENYSKISENCDYCGFDFENY